MDKEIHKMDKDKLIQDLYILKLQRIALECDKLQREKSLSGTGFTCTSTHGE